MDSDQEYRDGYMNGSIDGRYDATAGRDGPVNMEVVTDYDSGYNDGYWSAFNEMLFQLRG